MSLFQDVSKIASTLEGDSPMLQSIATSLQSIASSLGTIAKDLNTLVINATVVGIGVTPGPVTTHPEPKGTAPMQCKLLKGKQTPKMKAAKGASAPITSFAIADNGDATFTVFGLDAAGNTVDISSIATMIASSDNIAVLTVDAPVGMTSAMHVPPAPNAPAVGATANINIVATWNDGSVGPFSFTLPVAIGGSAVSGLTIVPGTPTTH